MVDRPPMPRLALTIGVAGHRPHRPTQPGEAPDPPFDAEKMRAAIDGVLDRLKRAVEEVAREDGGQFEGAPVVALVTSLAEGADRIAAEAARDAELPFDVVLPFAREDYLATFESEESRAEFDALAEKARATLILPRVADENPDEAAGRSYAQAAATVLAQSDLLLAVWDGAPARGKGGTAETVDEAARQATPIVVIDPLGGICLRWSGDLELPLPAQHASELPIERDLDAGLRDAVQALLHPPASKTELQGLRAYLEPSERRWPLPHVGWKFLRACLGLGLLDHGPKPEPPRHPAEAERMLADGGNGEVKERLDAAWMAADDVAVYYAHAFRSAFVANFLFGALAVACVAASLVMPDAQRPYWAAGELGFVAAVVVGTWIARRGDWRRRWFEARETAERLRLAPCFWTMGVWPNTLSSNQPAWTGWYVRALLRGQPVFSGDLSKLGDAPRKILVHVLEEQIWYHDKTKREAERADFLLEMIGVAAVCTSFAEPIVAIGEFFKLWTSSETLTDWLPAAAIVMPAVATACYGIRLLGDFEDTAHRSHRARKKLLRLKQLLETEPAGLAELRTRARQASTTMLADVESWRVTVESRNLSV